MAGGRCQAGKTIVNQVVSAICHQRVLPCVMITKGTPNQRDLYNKTSAGIQGVSVEMARTGEYAVVCSNMLIKKASEDVNTGCMIESQLFKALR